MASWVTASDCWHPLASQVFGYQIHSCVIHIEFTLGLNPTKDLLATIMKETGRIWRDHLVPLPPAISAGWHERSCATCLRTGCWSRPRPWGLLPFL